MAWPGLRPVLAILTDDVAVSEAEKRLFYFLARIIVITIITITIIGLL